MLIKTDDITKIKELDDAIFTNSSYSLNTYEHMVNSNEFYFISNNIEPIGFVVIQRVGDEYELIKVGVLENYRRHGYTYGALLELLATTTYDAFLLEVKSQNTKAISLYKKLGFELTGQRKDYYGEGVDAILMRYIKK